MQTFPTKPPKNLWDAQIPARLKGLRTLDTVTSFDGGKFQITCVFYKKYILCGSKIENKIL